jgi:hypothetical protein
MTKWHLVAIVPWLIVIGVGLGVEIHGMLNPAYPTFTGLVRRYVPMFVVFTLWCALGWHFWIRYYLPAPHFVK